MKNKVFVFFITLLVFGVLFLSYASGQGIPPSISGRAITAGNLLSGFGLPDDVYNNNARILTVENNADGSFDLTADHAGGYIYQEGYYWNPQNNYHPPRTSFHYHL